MKNFYLTILLVFASWMINAQALCVWTGASDNDFANNANWQGGTAPQDGDEVLFNSTSVNCDITVDVSLNGFTITSGYSGVITLNANFLVIQAGSFSQAGGTFSCGATPVYLTNFSDFDLSGGTFVSSSDLTDGLRITGGSFNKTGGTFTHNSGLVYIEPKAGGTNPIGSTVTFNILKIGAITPAGVRTVSFSAVTSASVILATSTNTMNYQGNLSIVPSATNVTSLLDLTGATGTGTPAANTGTFTFSGSGPVTITGATSNFQRAKLPNIVMSPSGNITMSNMLNVQGNWTQTSGTLSSGSSTVFFSGTSVISGAAINGVARNFDNLFIPTSGNVTFPTGTSNVMVGNTFSVAGTTNLASAGIGFHGASGALRSASAVTLSLLRVGTGAAAALNTTVTVLDSVKVDGTGALTTNGNLILPATSSIHGRIGRITSGSISGNVTMQMFLPGTTTGWGFLGSPGLQGQTVSAWDNKPSGLPMVCTGCMGGDPNYDPATYNGFHSVLTCDGNTFVTNVTVNTALTPGTGFLVYIGNGSSITTDITLSQSGSAVTGSVPLGVVNGSTSGFALLANPYPSPISIDAFMNVYAGDLNSPAFYMYNADIQDYDSPATGAVAPGQGFMIDVGPNGTVSVTFTEDMKTDQGAGTSVIRSASLNSEFKVNLIGAAKKDAITVRFNNEATMNYDRRFDIRRIPYDPPYMSTKVRLSALVGTQQVVVNTLPVLSTSASVPLYAKVGTTGTYTIALSDLKNVPNCVVLHDRFTGAYHDLGKAPYITTIADTANSQRFELLLCQSPDFAPVAIQEFSPDNHVIISQDAKGTLVRTSFPSRTDATLSAYNIVGQKLMNDIRVEGTETATYLPLNVHDQVVIIRVETNSGVTTKKIVTH
jgi:hypothetical protein